MKNPWGVLIRIKTEATVLGCDRENGKGNGNYRDSKGLQRGYIGIMEKKMETIL